MSAATTSRTSTRLAPGRRRLTPDDTFHRIDPTLSLHDEPTLHSATGGLADDADRLSDFARQVIEREAEGAGSADEHVDDGLFHPAEIGDMAAAVLAGVESGGGSPRDRGVMGQGMDSSSFEARPLPSSSTNQASGGGRGTGGSGSNGLDRNPVTSTQRTRSHSGNAQEDELVPDDEEDELEDSPVGNPGPRRGRKRKYALPLGPGETRDPIQMKKDSHKEVERRRREAINDGICDIQRLIPGLKDKAGKGSILRSAAEYIEDLQRQLGVSVSGPKMGGMGMNGMNMDNDRLERELAAVTAQLADEHSRSLTLETSWRDAEDRAAQNQFELERVKMELENAKMQLLEKRR